MIISSNKRPTGVTLIELMIAVAIVAILAAFAAPSYMRYLHKTNRTEATSALLALAAEQEKYILEHNAYATTMAQLGFEGDPPIQTNSKKYVLKLNDPAAANNGFRLTAEPDSESSQYGDEVCRHFQIDHTGARQVMAADAVTNNTALCWP